MQVRGATRDDADGLAQLLGAAGIAVTARSLDARLELFRREPGVVLLAEEWGPPSGVVAGSWVRSLATDAPASRIDLLLVAPDDRRRGIGRLLLKAFAQAARSAGCGVLHLPVPSDADALLGFCEASGFSAAGPLLVRPLRKGRGDG